MLKNRLTNNTPSGKSTTFQIRMVPTPFKQTEVEETRS